MYFCLKDMKYLFLLYSFHYAHILSKYKDKKIWIPIALKKKKSRKSYIRKKANSMHEAQL